MNIKKTLAAVMAAILVGSPVQATAVPYDAPMSAVVRIQCGSAIGTATHVGGGNYVSVKHVTSMGTCSVAGGKATDVHEAKHQDFSTFKGPVLPTKIEADCRGFEPGKVYMAVGYAFARMTQMVQPWLATSVPDSEHGMTTFIGEGIPGMSGGPVISAEGKVVGTVNMRWPTRSIPLKDTYFCKDS